MKKVGFEFSNTVSPSYIEPLLLRLESGEWYNNHELKTFLHNAGLNIDGESIVSYNVMAWSLSGIVRMRKEKEGRSFRNYIQLTQLGQYLRDVYSTNRELFFDLIHYIFYSTWKRSEDITKARFWVYAQVCDALWTDSPTQMDSFKLTNRLQVEAHQAFPQYQPAFSERSIGAVFPWVVALTPPFLEKFGAKSHYRSKKRDYCTPQLLHLATDLIYQNEKLSYGTSMALSEKHIEDICKVCLLDPAKFWSVADLSAMMIREFSIQRNQWGRSIVLKGPPSWIDLPDFSAKETTESEITEDEPEAEKSTVEPTDNRDEGDDEEEGELWI